MLENKARDARNCIVNFRVTVAEFEMLKAAARKSSYRSVSGYVRDLLLTSTNPSILARVEKLEREVSGAPLPLRAHDQEEGEEGDWE